MDERDRRRWLVASYLALLAGIVLLAADMHAFVQVDPDRSAGFGSQGTVRTGIGGDLGWGGLGGVLVALAIPLWIRANNGPPFRAASGTYAAVIIASFFVARSLLAQRGWSNGYEPSEDVEFVYHGWVLLRAMDPILTSVQPVILLAVLLGVVFYASQRLLSNRGGSP